ncbi:MAG TPA: lysylphosphatidylglycerol synthase transmembrane domain-containing protein [Dehalococcoidia bacterium]|nr:lysylphosphatidylglycerol synthase transmembrane domain-containing protein [Dehalococcoidia bacterium]
MGIEGDAAAQPDQARPSALRGRAFAAVRIVTTLAIVAGLIWKLSPSDLAKTLRHSNPWLMLLAVAMMVAVQALVIIKWRVLLRARDVALPAPALIRAYCVGNLLSNVLPTAVGGDVYRVYRVQRDANARAADVTMSVLYERATGYGAMTCLGALGAAFYFGSAGVGLLALVAGVAGAGVLALVLPRAPFPAFRHDHFLRNLLAHRRELLAVYQMVVFSLAIQALNISTIAVAGRALGIHISWWYWAFTMWVVAVAVLLPVTLGGLGVRESSFSALAKQAGATAAQGASAGFALGLLLIVANAAGLLAVEAAARAGLTHPAPMPEAPAATPEIATAER